MWTLKKLSYTYYYNWENDSPRFGFILEDPGNIQKRHKNTIEKIQQLKGNFDPLDLVDVYRGFASGWLLTGRNQDFTKNFLSTLQR